MSKRRRINQGFLNSDSAKLRKITDAYTPPNTDTRYLWRFQGKGGKASLIYIPLVFLDCSDLQTGRATWRSARASNPDQRCTLQEKNCFYRGNMFAIPILASPSANLPNFIGLNTDLSNAMYQKRIRRNKTNVGGMRNIFVGEDCVIYSARRPLDFIFIMVRDH